MIDNIPSKIKGSPIVKKAHKISNTTFVVIDDALVKQLEIKENDTWFEQEAIVDGIILRIRKGFPDPRLSKVDVKSVAQHGVKSETYLRDCEYGHRTNATHQVVGPPRSNAIRSNQPLSSLEDNQKR